MLYLNKFQKINQCLFSERSARNSELLHSPVPKCLRENVTSTVLENQQVFNYEPNQNDQQLHSKNFAYEIEFSSITILHIVVSQMVLVLFYCDLGFLFGNVSYTLLNIILNNYILILLL